jgi:hypothetical protein
MDRDTREELDATLDAWARWILRGFVGGLGYPCRSTLARIIESGPTAAAQ